MPRIKELIEKRNDLITRAEEITGAADSEGRDLTEDELKEVENIKGNVEGVDKQIDAAKTVEGLSKTAPAEENKETAKDNKTDEEKATEEVETRAFDAYLRDRWSEINERAGDNTPLSQGNNGAIVPLTIAKRIIAKLYEISPIAERATKYNIPGTFSIPYYSENETDYIDVAFQGAEFTKISANSGSFTTIQLGGYVAGALTLISRKMINNVEFDLVGYVVDRMAYSVRRFLENVLLNGSGAISGQTGTVEGLTGVTLTTKTTAASAITADDLINLQDSVKDLFQEGAMWIMSSKTRTAIRQLKSTTGSYLLNNVYDIKSGWGHELLGKPVYVSDNMPEIGDGKPVIYYGDMSGLALKFAENLEIQVLREKYADQHADGVIGWFEFDSKVENAQKIAKLVMGSGSTSE